MKTEPLSNRAKQGAILLPVIAVMVAIIIALGLGMMFYLRAVLERERANPIVKATALAGLKIVRSSDYVDAKQDQRPTDEQVWSHLQRVAWANGLLGGKFHPLRPGDVQVGATWVRVTVRPQRRGGKPYTATAMGVPTERIAAGRRWRGHAGKSMLSGGCMPLAIASGSLPGTGQTDPCWLPLAGDSRAAWCAGLPGAGASAAEHLRFSGPLPSESASGSAPPAVEVGDALVLESLPEDFLKELGERLVGRVVITPLVDGKTVVGFSRVRIEEVDAEKAAVRISLAPSAVSCLAASGQRAVHITDWKSDDVPVRGAVLRARLEG